ncbi:TonB-dependent receptor [Halioxenophilus aromaticivorans]|uniref:TonB-dependent receptor n=1 Tax=Halioxenophilus aromaticivorans TaxID=1306992 RepID=A0AAV3U8B9_9ALTE
MKLKGIAALIALASVDAAALEGVVVNAAGEAIAGAEVTSYKNKTTVTTGTNGEFYFQGEPGELHFDAAGFSHKIVHTDDRVTQNGRVTVTLAPTVIEQVDVVGLPIHASTIESAIPVAVLTGDSLREQQAATLGDTLVRQPGVNSNFHGNVASTPIIRGLSGPRVLITQNNLDVSDVSRVGPDHAVSTEVSTVQQVEILRGPATLFYGSGAIGGVVNIVDQRVPTDSETRGEFYVGHESVNDQKAASFSGLTGGDSWAIYGDGFWREADDYETPEPAEEGSDSTTVANSSEESSGYTLGGSYLLDNGYIGLSVGRLDREYGIPGHSHGEEGGEEESVLAELEQDRYQLQSEFEIASSWLRSIRTSAAYTDYTHAEIEAGTVGTTFSNETTEVRMDLMHQTWHDWQGGINLHYKNSEVAALGEEAFTPPSESETFAIALMEERHFGDFLVQLGARAEQVTITADSVLLPTIEAHLHDGTEDDAHDHDHAGEASVTRVFDVEHEFTPVSLSAGVVWDFAPGYNLGVSLSRAQRAPSAAELLSFGPHIGTRTYEIGALFLEDLSGDEAEFALSNADIQLETSNNIDLTFRKFEGDLGIVLNLFYNQVDDYYYQRATGLYTEFSHDHEHDHDHADGDEEEHADELPIYIGAHADADFYGFEAQGILKLSQAWQASVFSDYVRAKLADGGDLPRTPPKRFGFDIDYQTGPWSANVNWTNYAEQDKVAALETSTDDYDLLAASVTYRLPFAGNALALFAKVENITDAEARVHTSFIKDVAPLPGRNFRLGLRGSF